MNKVRKMRAFILLAAAAYLLASAAGQPPSSFYLHPGDTVVFYGDSITEQRLYTMITELYAVTRYPDLKAAFIHSGWGGDRVSGGGGGPIDVRLQRDVFAYKPMVMTLMLGMNDGNYTAHKAADDEVYYKGYQHIIEAVRQTLPGIRITALEPSPFDDVTRPIDLQPDGYNAVLVRYSDWIRRYASEKGLTVADLNAPVVDMLRKANASDPETAKKIIGDRVHPSLSGHLIMAEQLLKAWNARPLVSAVTIDADAGKVVEAKFAKITDFHGGGAIGWTELDEALPLPFAEMLANDRDHTIALAIRSSDITEALNQEPLRINGLKTGTYKLTVDSQPVGTFSDVELARGVNLAVLDTPMSKQAAEVQALTIKHIDIHQCRWRTLQVPLQSLGAQHLDDSLKALDSVEADVVARQRSAAQPKPHVFQLTPAA